MALRRLRWAWREADKEIKYIRLEKYYCEKISNEIDSNKKKLKSMLISKKIVSLKIL